MVHRFHGLQGFPALPVPFWNLATGHWQLPSVANFRRLAQKHALAMHAIVRHAAPMKALFTYWQEADGRFLGYLNDYPEHWTQGEDLEDLKEQLRDLFATFTKEQIPGIRKVEALEVA